MRATSLAMTFAAILLAVVIAAPAAAQRQSGEDCALPGGCGNSSKPGGAERGPASGTTGAAGAPAGRGSAEPPARADGTGSPSLKDVMRKIGRGLTRRRDDAEATK